MDEKVTLLRLVHQAKAGSAFEDPFDWPLPAPAAFV